MKKLLIATMAAVSVGLYAKAADAGFISGTSFEGDEFNGNGQLVIDDQDGYWEKDVAASDDDLYTVANLPENTSYPSRPAMWAGATNGKALAIDTSAPLIRNVKERVVNGDKLVFPAQDVTPTPVFFDSVVQFTATDVKPTVDLSTEVSNKDKLLVWLYQSPDGVSVDNPGEFGETTAETNLVITAGAIEIEGQSQKLVQMDYKTNISIEPDTWHRVTIKSFVVGGFLKFNVWIDGNATPITVDDVTDFISLVSDTDKTLQGVAFDGKGAVDDIVFTTTDPFYVAPEEAEKVNVSVSINDFDAAITAAMFNGVQVDSGSVTIECDKDSTNTLMFMLNNDYELVSSSPKASFDDQIGIYTITVVPDSDMTVTIVVQSIAGGGEGGGTDEPGTDDPETPTVYPTSGTLSAVVAGDANAEADAIAAQVTISISDADTAAGVTTAYFKKTAVYDQANSQWVVTVALDETVVQPSADEALEDVAAALTGDETTVSITYAGDDIKPGLYYGLAVAGDLTALETAVPANFERATASGVLLSADKPEGNAGFFKVVISATNPNPVQE